MIALRTKITQQDLKIYASERLTQNDDGGGMPIGTPLTGKPNELFKPIPSIARLSGAFYAALEYMGVLRPDNEPLYGTFAAITKPPSDPTVSYLMFKATRFGESRAEILKRIEAYNVATIESKLTLLSTQSKNSRIIQAYQRVEETLPLIGDVYCLRQDKKGYEQAEQYVQITRIIKAEKRTFTNPRTSKDFDRMVIQMEISTKLEADFIGADYPDESYIDNPCKLRETAVADAAQFYGVKPIVSAIKKDVMQIKIAGIMEKIVPTNQIPIPLVDLTAAGQRQTLFDGSKSGTDGIVTLAVNKSHTVGGISSIYFGNAVTPSSVEIATNGGTIADKGGTLYLSDKAVGSIDYANGFATINEPTYSGYLNSAKYRPASSVLKVADTSRIPVDINNRSSSYTFNIDPPPAVGTLQVSYRSQGKWNTLSDDGSGVLRGASVAHGSGNVSFITGSGQISLQELPDVGSAILLSWGTRANYFNRSDSKPKTKMVLQLSKPAIPSTIALSWVNNGDKVATGNRMDNITGDWTGHYDRATNQILIDVDNNFTHPAGSIDVTVRYATAEDSNTVGSMNYTFDVDSNGIASGALYEPSLKGTIFINWVCARVDTGEVIGNASLSDDGNGNLVNDKGETKGTIDYDTGKFSFDSNKSVTVNIPIYQSEERPVGAFEVYQSA